jgi:hypothetical protein
VQIIEADVFYLEVCVFHQVCANGDDLFRLDDGELFTCNFDEGRFRTLQRLLQGRPLSGESPFPPPSPPSPPSPPLPRSDRAAAVVALLNRRWREGRPSDLGHLEEAGNIMWVIDGDGRDLNGINTHDPWAPIPNSPTGDRHSASIVSKRHPYLFACFACHPDFQFNPGLVLAPSAATRSRLMCHVHADIGTFRYSCNPTGRSEWCRPGCGNNVCGQDPPYRTWQCAWPADQLKRMMETHDGLGTGWYGPMEADNFQQNYNELLFSSMGDDAWEGALGKLVSAVFVQKRGNEKSKANARALRASLLQHVPAGGQPKPLVEYDPSAEDDAFTLLEG